MNRDSAQGAVSVQRRCRLLATVRFPFYSAVARYSFTMAPSIKTLFFWFAAAALVTCIPTKVQSRQISNKTSPAPSGCNRLNIDSDWPSIETWVAALPNVQPLGNEGNQKHPDYRLAAKSYKDVQDAVTFCAKNKIRLTVITSGHDFLGR